MLNCNIYHPRQKAAAMCGHNCKIIGKTLTMITIASKN